MNLTHLHPKRIQKSKVRKQKLQLNQHQICCQNIRQKKFLSKHGSGNTADDYFDYGVDRQCDVIITADKIT